MEFQQVAVYIEEGNQAKEFIYNYLEWIAASIAEAYKRHWLIENLFKPDKTKSTN